MVLTYSKKRYSYILIFAVLLLLLLHVKVEHPHLGLKLQAKFSSSFSAQSSASVLVLYVFVWNNEYALPNMVYFIENAVRETDPVDYYFILQQVDNKNINESLLPTLPRNAHYVHHENRCFDFGTAGWFISEYTIGNPYINETSINGTNKIDITKYKYFILLNSSTRGPYLPPFYSTLILSLGSQARVKHYWFSVFTERINDKVKLVGPTICCSYAPHVQGFMVVTDFVGLSIGLKSANMGGPFDCHATFEDAVLFGEIGFSMKVTAEGYMISCLMRKYDHLNFSAPENLYCNAMGNPNQYNGVDNISLDPYEIVFIKYNYKRDDWYAPERAKVYHKWTEEVKNSVAQYY